MTSFARHGPSLIPPVWPRIHFLPSSLWTVPCDGLWRICAVGGGGGGGAIYNTTSGGNNGGSASGGGGGGYCEVERFLRAGTALKITRGASGASAVSSSAGTGANGGDGTASIVVGGGINMVAYGGIGGSFRITNGALSGGAGGSWGGGDYGFNGGAGGACTHGTDAGAASGGGASGSPLGVGGDGGSCSSTGAGASGGGACGGFRGGDSTGSTSKGGGGGTGGNGGDVSGTSNGAGGPNRLGLVSTASFNGFPWGAGFTPDDKLERCLPWIFGANPFYLISGGGTAGAVESSAPGPGAGSGGTDDTSASVWTVFGGCGGASASAVCSGFGAVWAGGGGGCASLTTGPATSGRGGVGLVLIELIGWEEAA